MKKLSKLVPAAALIATLLASGSLVFANKEIQKKEKKPCTTCHTKGKELNDVGKFYKEKKTLEGAPAPTK